MKSLYLKNDTDILEDSNNSRIGLSQEELIKTFEKDSYFCIDDIFLFKICKNFEDFKLFMLLGNRCIKEIFYNIVLDDIYHQFSEKEIMEEYFLYYFNNARNKILELKKFQ